MTPSRTQRFVEVKSSPGVTSGGQEEVHFVPFKVEYEGDTRVKGLFTNQATKHPLLPNVSCNYFRGRPLQGTKFTLPPDFVAFVGEDLSCTRRMSNKSSKIIHQKEEEDKEEDIIQIGQAFQELTYWEWDKPPTSMDSIVKLQDWLQLSNVIHEPIELKI